jgi:hypothetical protein
MDLHRTHPQHRLSKLWLAGCLDSDPPSMAIESTVCSLIIAMLGLKMRALLPTILLFECSGLQDSSALAEAN